MDDAIPFVILLVEDEIADAHLVRLGLEASHICTALHHAGDCRAAFDYLQNPANPRPSLILLDLNMPLMDGHECLAILKQTPAWADIPVVILTSSAAEHDFRKSRVAGAATFITKPADVSQFFAAIGNLVDTYLGTAN